MLIIDVCILVGQLIFEKNMTIPSSMAESGFDLYKETITGNTVMPSLSSNKLEKEVILAIAEVQNTLLKDIKKMFSGPFWSFMRSDVKLTNFMFPFPSMTVFI